MARAAEKPQRFALPPLLCARCRKVEATLGDKVILGAGPGWVCDACRRGK